MPNIINKKPSDPTSYLKPNKVTEVTDLNNSKVTQGNSLKVKLPLLVDLKSLPITQKKHKKKGYDHYAYILGTMVYKAEVRRLSYGTYWSFSREALRRLLGGDYNKVIKELIKAEYIQEYSNPYTYIKDGKKYYCKGLYSTTKGKAKRYALNTDKFKGEDDKILFKDYTITDKTLVDKINSQRVEATKRVIEAYPIAKRVFENIKELSINDLEAEQFLFEKYKVKEIKRIGRGLVKQLGKNNTKKLIREIQSTKSLRKLKAIFKQYNPKFYGKPFTDEQILYTRQLLGSYNSLVKRLHTISVLKQIEQGNYEAISISRDAKTGRLFHNLTMTPKDLKPFLRIQDEKLVEIDGSNAQWSILVDYLKNLCHILDSNSSFKKNSYNTYLKGGSLETPPNRTNTNSNRDTIGTPYTYMCHSFSSSEEYNRYKGNVERELYSLEAMIKSNTFRSYFVEKYKAKGKEVSDGYVKGKLIKYILFGNVNATYYKERTDIVKMFKERYPYLHQILVDLKTKHIDNEAFGYELRDQWKCLALVLQSKEAEVFVDTMGITDAFFITLHDAIITNRTNEAKVYKTLQEALKINSLKMSLNREEY